MDKIWDENPSKSEVIGRCGGDEKTNDHAEQTNLNASTKKNLSLFLFLNTIKFSYLDHLSSLPNISFPWVLLSPAVKTD